MNLRNGILCLAAGAVFSTSGVSEAAEFYGDYFGDTVNYLNVKEDTPALFQEPVLSGDSLIFNPTSFDAQSSGIGAEIVDGTLSFILESKNGLSLEDLIIEETGFYTLVGLGTNVTQVLAGLAATVQIIEVDGAASAISGPPSFLNYSETFADFNLADDGPAFLAAWDGQATFSIQDDAESQLGVTGQVTKVAVTINNSLVAVSESGSASFIDKKGFRSFVVTVPEPGTMVLLVSGVALLAVGRNRKSA